MSERRLTVSGLLREPKQHSYSRASAREVPFVRMRGAWLKDAGFAVGEKVRVEVEPGRLVLTPVEG